MPEPMGVGTDSGLGSPRWGVCRSFTYLILSYLNSQNHQYSGFVRQRWVFVPFFKSILSNLQRWYIMCSCPETWTSYNITVKHGKIITLLKMFPKIKLFLVLYTDTGLPTKDEPIKTTFEIWQNYGWIKSTALEIVFN